MTSPPRVSMEIIDEVVKSMNIGLVFQGYVSLCYSPKLPMAIACWKLNYSTPLGSKNSFFREISTELILELTCFSY